MAATTTAAAVLATTTKCTKHLNMGSNSSSLVDHSAHVGHGSSGGVHDMMMSV